MARKIRNDAGKLRLHSFLTGQDVGNKFTELSTEEFAAWLIEQTEHIRAETTTRSKIGTDIKRDTVTFLDEYRKRKEGTSFKIWKSKFPTINKEIGGYLSGNVYTWYGRSGRGKSIFTMEEAIEAAAQGANVLVWAMEMSRFEWMARAYSSISARQGAVNANIDGVDYEVGFENRALLNGKLTEEFEKGFEQFLTEINEIIPGTIVVRTVDDIDFSSRRVRDLEADIVATKADVVVIDPYYYMTYEANRSKTTGGDATETSNKIRALAGRYQCVIHGITQAEEVRDDRDDEGNRELRPPTRAELMKSKSFLQDSALTIGIDTLDGIGVIQLNKGRNGGEGVTLEVIYMPNYGLVRELPSGEAAADQFKMPF
ncbi:AAA family ATPase [Brevibacillus laterosporus]|uniref:AAA family ATPase n=1 Tax=Brevibacillus laterosporus TaxID=1465 RepID=UPI002652FD45|nr:AAA family ATPase [Brevibacillus laterosporus]MDN9010022.1 DnaB-like helicase C-terminal domain-containing protein [Brevibacillus laterosporus]MDO0940596.1 DnaB-like helicase C-terminal domain-containing protein [Brevibacillus laterosporus]